MSRTYKKKILKPNGLTCWTGNKMRPYCSLYFGWSLKFWYTQVSFGAKQKMRNANRTLKKRTRQYNKKEINLGILEWEIIDIQ